MSTVTATHGALLSCSVPVVPLHTLDHRGAEVHGEGRAPLSKFGCFESATRQGNFLLHRSSLMELGWNGFVGVLGGVPLDCHVSGQYILSRTHELGFAKEIGQYYYHLALQ